MVVDSLLLTIFCPHILRIISFARYFFLRRSVHFCLVKVFFFCALKNVIVFIMITLRRLLHLLILKREYLLWRHSLLDLNHVFYFIHLVLNRLLFETICRGHRHSHIILIHLRQLIVILDDRH